MKNKQFGVLLLIFLLLQSVSPIQCLTSPYCEIIFGAGITGISIGLIAVVIIKRVFKERSFLPISDDPAQQSLLQEKFDRQIALSYIIALAGAAAFGAGAVCYRI